MPACALRDPRTTGPIRAAVIAVTVTLCAGAGAQQAATLPEVVVTGNPLGTADRITPATSLSGPALLLQRKSSLGETLAGEAGVSSTYFGPTASRPVIRGLDGDRIRILSNGTGTADVSGLSYDHAVAADPIAIERLDVLRGPAALMYGGSAVGGVVNLIDNRIPREPVDGPWGRIDLSASSGNRERAGAALLEAGNSRLGLHADAYERQAGEVRVPLALDCERSDARLTVRRLCNSAAGSRGGAVGASLFFPQGRLGASLSEHRSHYGSPAEEAVGIGLRQNRAALEGQWQVQGALIESVSAQWSATRYRHTESEDAVPGTTFRNRAQEARVELRHTPWGPLRGLIGWQAQASRFSADGDEVYSPYSRTDSSALFLHEAWATAWGRLELGARTERVQVRSLGHPLAARFAAAERQFSPSSLALGALWKMAPGWELSSHWAQTARAPRDYELFANGPHVATGAWEIGAASLDAERSLQLDAGLAWSQGRHKAHLTAYERRFANYLALSPTGRLRDQAGHGAALGVTDCGDGTSVESGCASPLLPEYAYQAVRARFTGLEAGGVWALHTGAPLVDLEWRADLVRARNLQTGEGLPRIAPWRVGATWVVGQQPWSLRAGFDHFGAQTRGPAGQIPTAAYTLWQLGATWRQQAAGAALTWFARLDNATDRLAFSATSILTQTAPGRVPLPGRSLRAGVQATF